MRFSKEVGLAAVADVPKAMPIRPRASEDEKPVAEVMETTFVWLTGVR